MPVNLKYFNKYPNVGDQFSRIVAQHYISPNINGCNQQALAEPNVLLLGSILEWSDTMSLVCGAGLISANSILRARPKHINCVRGPLTGYFLERQGINAGRIYGDPGILVAKLFPAKTPDSKRTKVGLIPHYVDLQSAWVKHCEDNGITIIDTLSSVTDYIEKLQQCEVILSSSLHGIIFAHAYGKRALWVELSDRVIGNGFKFYDYYLSIGVAPNDVTRFRIDGNFDAHCSTSKNFDPYNVAELATPGNHAELLPKLEAALYLTKQQLEEAN